MTLEDVAELKEKLGELDDLCHALNLPPIGIFWRLKAFLRALLRRPPEPMTPEELQKFIEFKDTTKEQIREKACEAYPGTTPDDWTFKPIKEEEEDEVEEKS